MKKLLSNGFIATIFRVVGGRVFGSVAGFATQILLARTLSQEGLGTFFWAGSLAVVFGATSALGYPGSAVRFITRYRAEGNEKLAAAFIYRTRRDVRITGTVLMVATGLVFAVLPGLDSDTRWAVMAALVTIPAIASIRLNGALATALRDYNWAYLPDLILKPLLLLIAVAVLNIIQESFVVTASAMQSLSNVAIATLLALHVRRSLPPPGDYQPPRRLVRTWRRLSNPLLIVTLYLGFLADIDLAIVGWLLPRADLAVYGVAIKLAFLVGFAIQAVHEIVSPDIVDGHLKSDPAAVRSALRRANLLTLAACVVALAGAVVLGEQVLAIFGAEYRVGYPVLLTLLAAQTVRALFGPNTALLIAAGRQVEMAGIFLASAFVLLGLNLALVPLGGGVGAGLAVLLTFAFTGIGLAVLLKRRMGARADFFASMGRKTLQNRSDGAVEGSLGGT